MAAISATTIGAVQTALVAASVAVAADDFATAYKELAHAELALAGLPLTNVKEGLTAQLRASLKSAREAVDVAKKTSTAYRFEKRSRHVP